MDKSKNKLWKQLYFPDYFIIFLLLLEMAIAQVLAIGTFMPNQIKLKNYVSYKVVLLLFFLRNKNVPSFLGSAPTFILSSAKGATFLLVFL